MHQEHVFWTVVSYSTLILTHFYTFFLIFLTAFSAYNTYGTHSSYKYPSKTHYFLTPYLLPSSSLSHFYTMGHKEVNLGVNLNLLLFTPKIILPWVKRLFLGVRGIKRTRFRFPPTVDIFLPQNDWSLFPPNH